MNNIEKAIETLKDMKGVFDTRGHKQYSLSAIDSAISALEKQIPKKIDRVGNKCPVCKCYLASKPIGDNYCFNCNQAIDWGNEDE